MRNSVYLCILIITCYCDAEWNWPRRQFVENEMIDIPENCSISVRGVFRKKVLCPDFTMYLNHFVRKHYGDIQEHHEYSTVIQCTNSSIPYQYLRNANSNRNSLELVNCQPPESGSFGEGWSRLEYLKIRSYKGELQQLKREHFSDLKNIWYLQLITMQVMPDDLFADLPKLRIIEMSVEHANKKLFANLNELVSLDLTILSPESLNNFDTSELKSAPKFKELKLQNFNFTRMTKQFFEGCSNIDHLDLSFNTIETIDFDAFKPLTNLKNIEMNYNELASIPLGMFSNNKKLETVKISEFNYISYIPPGLLSNLTNLREVIMNCNLISVPNDLLHGSKNLEMLDLQWNQLTSLPRDLFQNHSKLRVVKLFGNAISAFPNDRFYDKSNLTELKFTVDYY